MVRCSDQHHYRGSLYSVCGCWTLNSRSEILERKAGILSVNSYDFFFFFFKVSWWKQNIDLKETNARAWHLCTCWCKDIKTLKLRSYLNTEVEKSEIIIIFFNVHLQLAYLQSVTLFSFSSSSTFFLSFSFICCCFLFNQRNQKEAFWID